MGRMLARGDDKSIWDGCYRAKLMVFMLCPCGIYVMSPFKEQDYILRSSRYHVICRGFEH